MSLTPVWLFWVSREQSIMDCIPDLPEIGADRFLKSSFIAEFIEKFIAADDDY